MNIDDYRDFCLSLGSDVKEDLSYDEFKAMGNKQIFYVSDHMFSFYNCDDVEIVTLKCQPERIAELKGKYDCIGEPYNLPSSSWIGVNPFTAPNNLLKELTRNSYELMKAKYGEKQ